MCAPCPNKKRRTTLLIENYYSLIILLQELSKFNNFNTNISDINGHQTTIQISALPNLYVLLHYRRKTEHKVGLGVDTA